MNCFVNKYMILFLNMTFILKYIISVIIKDSLLGNTIMISFIEQYLIILLHMKKERMKKEEVSWNKLSKITLLRNKK